jgi:hypothetical protein
VKISDLGMVKEAAEENLMVIETKIVDEYYQAPELVLAIGIYDKNSKNSFFVLKFVFGKKLIFEFF